MRISIIALLFSTIFNTSISAQEHEKEAIEQVITSLFDGMRAGDSSKVASTFTKDGIMHTVSTNQEGKVVRTIGSLGQFLNAVGTPHEDIWDEQLSSITIQLDDNLASVWTPYTFFVGDTFSHCGINSFQMAKLEGEWKIMYIVDTRRRENCLD